MPISSSVGTLGSAGLRTFDATASAFILPPAMNGRHAVVSSSSVTSPVISPSSAGAVPLYGTCTMSMPVARLNISVARCCEEPTPPEP